MAYAGLGIWDTTTNKKFTIEFLSDNYVGGLLPNCSDGYIHWQNAASIVITDPIDDSAWLNSRLITTTSGNAWTQIITYLKDNTNKYTTYQPVTALYLNASLVNSSVITSNDDIDSIGSLVLAPTNSFAFVSDLINQLGSYGCDLGAFLQIYSTSFDYSTNTSAAPTTVEWTSGDRADPGVYLW